jgi:hypothetical protein
VASRNAVRMATWSFFASGNPTRDARAATRTACCRATQDSKRYLPLSRGHGPLAAQLTGAEVMRVRKHCAQTLETTHHIKTPGRLSRSRTCMVLTASINLPSVDLQKKKDRSVKKLIRSGFKSAVCVSVHLTWLRSKPKISETLVIFRFSVRIVRWLSFGLYIYDSFREGTQHISFFLKYQCITELNFNRCKAELTVVEPIQ